MSDRAALERLFLEHRDRIRTIAGFICRRNALARYEAEDFASWVELHIVQDDYAILRKFRGESSVSTYLAVVIAMLFRDYRVKHWGRWRPSAAARSRGLIAMRLEALVYRDGYSFRQAAELLRSGAPDQVPTERELVALFAALPRRAPVRPVTVGAEAIVTAPAPERADAAVTHEELEQEHDGALAALAQAIEELPTEDRLIVRLHFWEGLSIADVARALAVPQKPLYRRLERALATLRAALESAGMTRDDVALLLGERVP